MIGVQHQNNYLSFYEHNSTLLKEVGDFVVAGEHIAIPQEFSLGDEFQGVLLFVILASCLIMTLSLISYKKKRSLIAETEENPSLEAACEDMISEEEDIENK